MANGRNYLIIIGMDLTNEPTIASVKQALEQAHISWNKNQAKDYYAKLLDEYKEYVRYVKADEASGQQELKDEEKEKREKNPIWKLTSSQQSVHNAYEEATQIVNGRLDKLFNHYIKVLKTKSIPKEYFSDIRSEANNKINDDNGSEGFTLEDSYILSFSEGKGITWTGSDDEYEKRTASLAQAKQIAKQYTDIKPAYKPYKNVETSLKNEGFEDLFAFACPNPDKNGRDFEPQQLLAWAEAKATEANKHRGQTATDMGNLFQAAKKAFKSDESVRDYKDYLLWLQFSEGLNDRMKLHSNTGMPINHEEQHEIEDYLKGQGWVKPDDVGAFLVGYCANNNIVLESGFRVATIQWCYCGHANDKGDKFCHRCGMPLMVKCPHCGKMVPNSEDVCPKCGKPVGLAIKEAKKSCDLARQRMDSLDLDAATQALESAKKSWPDFTDIAPLEQELKAKQAAMGDKVRQLRQAMDRREYFSAKAKLAQILAGAPATGPLLAQQTAIEQACDDANDLVAQANSATGARRDQLLCDAYSMVHDQPQARTYVQSTPPEQAGAVTAVASKGATHISWHRPASGGELTYVVVRKEGSRPLSESDGDTLTHTPITDTAFVDKEMPQGVDVYYGVVVKRYGNSSAMSVSSPCSLLGELEGLEVHPGDSAIELSWKPISTHAHVVIRDGRGQEVARTQATHYTIGRLTNGTSYRYSVSLVYGAGTSERVAGKPQVVEATPLDTDDYIFQLSSRRSKTQKGVFDLTWEECPGETRFFSTDSSRAIPPLGSVTTVGELGRKFDPVAVANQTATTGRVLYSGEDVLCVFAVSVFGTSAIVGATVRLSAVESIKVEEVYVDRDRLALRVVPPKHFSSIVVLSRPDRYVTSLQESGPDVTRDVTLSKAYEENGLVKGPVAESRRYFLSVFVVMGSGADSQSDEPVELVFDNAPRQSISYEMKLQKKLFGKGKLVIRFWVDGEDEFDLPDATVKFCRGRVPHMSDTAREVASVQGRHVRGSYTLEVDAPQVGNTFAEVIALDGNEDQFECTSPLKVS